jgi:hypothetical protein
VSQRTREFGIRVALGAEGPAIVRGVLAGGARLVSVVVEAVVSLWIGMVRSVLYEVEPTDPATFLLAMTVMAAVGVLGGIHPGPTGATSGSGERFEGGVIDTTLRGPTVLERA